MNRPRTLALSNAALSAVLLALLGAGFVLSQSQLAFAQAADSLLDLLTASVLLWTLQLASHPPDADHHFGHGRAEPIGALITAVIAALLALEVIRQAIGALLSDAAPGLSASLLAVFIAKFGCKLAIFFFARREGARRASPAMNALAVDARNDALAGSTAIVGFFAAQWGSPSLDAYLAIPVGLWIGHSGYALARENIALLMGQAPSASRQRELLELARRSKAVRDAHHLRAQYLGTQLQVHLHIVVDPSLTVREAHEIGRRVKERLEKQADVGDCSVHIDIR